MPSPGPTWALSPSDWGARVATRLELGDCWVWTGAKSSAGYGQVRIDGKLHYTHRLTWESLVGSIPDGKEIDHLCRNRACCNPDHLEPVDRRTNIRRGYTHAPRPRPKSTHCAAGHALEGDNLYVMPSGRRNCRICRVNRKRRWRANRRAAGLKVT